MAVRCFVQNCQPTLHFRAALALAGPVRIHSASAKFQLVLSPTVSSSNRLDWSRVVWVGPGLTGSAATVTPLAARRPWCLGGADSVAPVAGSAACRPWRHKFGGNLGQLGCHRPGGNFGGIGCVPIAAPRF